MENGSRWSRLATAGLAAGLAMGWQSCGKARSDQGNKQGTSSESRAGSPDSSAARHACRGKNACKGQGGCAVTASQLGAMAAKAGIPLEKAGAAHQCKGRNECKGLGGCGM